MKIVVKRGKLKCIKKMQNKWKSNIKNVKNKASLTENIFNR